MDAFTQRMLERAQARREKLDKQLNSVGQPTSSKKRPPLLESNQDASVAYTSDLSSNCSSPSPKKSNLTASRKMSSASPKRASQGGRRVSYSKSPRKEATPPPPPRSVTDTDTDEDEEMTQTDTDNEREAVSGSNISHKKEQDKSDGESAASMTNEVRSRLKRLGALYSDSEQLSSPIHRTESNFSAEPIAQKTRNKSATRSARLTALANTINQWEDDLSHPSAHHAKVVAPPKSVSRFNSCGMKRKSIDNNDQQGSSRSTANLEIPSKASTNSRLPGIKASRKSGGSSNFKRTKPVEVTSSPTKQLQWDKAMLDSLESQGFTRSSSNSRLIYDYDEKSHNTSNESEVLSNLEEDEVENQVQKSPVKKDYGSPSKNFAKFTSPSRSPLVMGVSQLRNNSSPAKQANGSPTTSLSSPVKSQFTVKLKPISVDESKPEGSVLQRAAKYESEASSPSKRLARDPAELPLSERMALFEKNKGPLLVPKVPFSTPMPAKLLKENEFAIQQSTKALPKAPCPPIKEPILNLPKSPSKVQSSVKQAIEESAVLRRLQLFEAGKVGLEESPSRPQNQAVAERQKEMEMLSSRWNRNKEFTIDEANTSKTKSFASPLKASHKLVSGTPPPPPPPMPGSPKVTAVTPTRRSPRRPPSQDVYPGVAETKRIKVSPPKPGCLYPSLSDVEVTSEAEYHSSADHSFEDAESSLEIDPDNSFGKDILEAADKVHSSYRSNKDSKDDVSVTESTVLKDMDDFLEEALDESSDDEQSPTPPKKTRITASKKSDSFHYKSSVKETPQEQTLERQSPRRASTKYRAPQPPCTPSSSSTEDQQMPLMHTVSFYRKQQNMTPRTPARQVQNQLTPEKLVSQVDHERQESEHERNLVEVRVRALLDDVSKQQTVISQASQALNLCIATVEFSGSAEQVEGERLLLLATHKRQAALNEIQRLKVEGTLRPQNPSGHDMSNFSEHGTLYISDVTLPVKRDFVRSIAAEDNSHHFVCLAKCQDVVLATSVLSIANTRDLQGGQSLRFASSLTLADLYSNFKVTLEIYTMSCRREMLPHDIKYHINKKESSKHRMTPKKQKQESHLSRPPVQSPAGPGAVRSPQFSLIGYVVFSLREIQRTSFTLNKVPYTSPLEGSIQLRLKCDLSLDIEHRGFLTMYEVVSGYGAWHRRWCLLKGEMLSYWKYPDHERKEVPIGSIDLRSCVTENVGLVTRDLCARLNTFLLETSRPAKSTDQDSLDMVCKGDVTHVRHLLSADTKEERVEWCTQLNKALTVIRAWGKKTDL